MEKPRSRERGVKIDLLFTFVSVGYIVRKTATEAGAMDKKEAKELALAMAVMCVRNTYLEDLHSGTVPSSKSGDYSDVKVVSPYGDIEWNRLSRLSDEEMRILMKEVVNKLYSFLLRLDDPDFITGAKEWGRLMTVKWDEPEDTFKKNPL